MSKIAKILVVAVCLVLGAATLAAEQPPASPVKTQPEQAQSEVPSEDAGAASAPDAGCPAAPPAEIAVRAPESTCPPVPGEHKEFLGPYWTEKKLTDTKPFICPQYSYPEKAARKFGRGVANIVTAPVELFNQPLNYLYRTERSGFISNTTAVLVGVPAGVGWVIYRALAGVFDIVTFAVPPFRPVIDPEFVSNDFQKRRVLEIKSPEPVPVRRRQLPD